MLLRMETLRAIVAGEVTLAFRRWKRPTVKPTGTLLTAVGVLAVDAVEPVELDEIDEAQAQAAGFDDLAALRTALSRKREGELYRIELRYTGPDPRLALREAIPDADEMDGIAERLARMDRSRAWTHRVLHEIAEHPGVRAPELAVRVGMEKAKFKANVRKLKGMGLTESLEVGYRLSKRGESVLRHLAPRGED